MCGRWAPRSERIVRRLKERLEALKVELLGVELGLMMGEPMIHGGK